MRSSRVCLLPRRYRQSGNARIDRSTVSARGSRYARSRLDRIWKGKVHVVDWRKLEERLSLWTTLSSIQHFFPSWQGAIEVLTV